MFTLESVPKKPFIARVWPVNVSDNHTTLNKIKLKWSVIIIFMSCTRVALHDSQFHSSKQLNSFLNQLSSDWLPHCKQKGWPGLWVVLCPRENHIRDIYSYWQHTEPRVEKTVWGSAFRAPWAFESHGLLWYIDLITEKHYCSSVCNLNSNLISYSSLHPNNSSLATWRCI